MEILEAYDVTGSLRGAAVLAGCDHKTVAHWVRAREEAGGGLPVASRARPRVDRFAGKIDEWVDRSRGRMRADKAHERLVVMGYMGCGVSGITVTGRGSRVVRRCCSARGLRGRVSVWYWRCGIALRRAS
jgi:hypothetical protein